MREDGEIFGERRGAVTIRSCDDCGCTGERRKNGKFR